MADSTPLHLYEILASRFASAANIPTQLLEPTEVSFGLSPRYGIHTAREAHDWFLGMIAEHEEFERWRRIGSGSRRFRSEARRCGGRRRRSFFATLETELIERKRFRNQAEARMAMFDFIEAWYNPRRRHSALGQMSPINYEKEHAQVA